MFKVRREAKSDVSPQSALSLATPLGGAALSPDWLRHHQQQTQDEDNGNPNNILLHGYLQFREGTSSGSVALTCTPAPLHLIDTPLRL